MTTIDVDPEISAAYAAMQDMVAENSLPVVVDDPHQLTRIPATFEGLIAASEPAYSVRLIINRGFVTVSRTGRFGFVDDNIFVNHPVPHGSDDFSVRLAAAVLTVVERELERAAAAGESDLAEHGPHAAFEARDAVRRIG